MMETQPEARDVTGGLRMAAAALVAMAAVTVGCAKKDPFGRQPLEGSISWEGKPIAVGVIAQIGRAHV